MNVDKDKPNLYDVKEFAAFDRGLTLGLVYGLNAALAVFHQNTVEQAEWMLRRSCERNGVEMPTKEEQTIIRQSLVDMMHHMKEVDLRDKPSGAER